MYLGEVARLIIEKLSSCSLVLTAEQKANSRFSQPNKFSTRYLTDIANGKNIFADVQVTQEQFAVVQKVCHLVVQRAARLAAVGIAAILVHSDRSKVASTVAVDGALFEKYPRFEEMMQQMLKELDIHHCSI